MPIWMLLVPTQWPIVGLFMVHQIARNTIGHSGYEIFPARGDGRHMLDFLTTTTHHDLHHAMSRWNYGLYFTWWDRWMGTEHPDYYARFASAARPLRSSKRKASAQTAPWGEHMNFYNDCILPHVINLSMRNRMLLPYRERVLSFARGRVLEIGIGSGLNLPFYGPGVDQILGLDPAARLIAMAQGAAGRSKTPVTLVTGSAEAIPVDDDSIDTVVTTWTLCSIPDAVGALREMRRVLRPDGQLLFVEHGLAAEEKIRKWQNRLTPLWKKIGGGCHLNRPIRALIESAGFNIVRLDSGYLQRPSPMTFLYEGCAAPQ